MNRFLIRTFAAIMTISVAVYVGCSDLDRVSGPTTVGDSMITSVVPSSGPVGTRVLIGGFGFGADSSSKQIYFNNTVAPVETPTDTSVLTRVPEEARTGPVKMLIEGDTLIGPEFTVDTTRNFLLEIKSLNPAEGRYGDPVEIIGSGFETEPAQNSIYFSGVPAKIESVTDTSLTTSVPPDAQTGPIMVVAGQDTAIGPNFTVIVPEITSVSPSSGPVGAEVNIEGSNFSATASENTITFNGTEAPVESAEENQLVTRVPEDATDGPVEVTVSGATATGPDFDVLTDGTLEAIISTSGSDMDSNGYLLTTDSGDTLQTEINDTLYVSELDEGSHQVELSGLAANCMLSETSSNPRSVDITAGDTTSTTFSVNCQEVVNSGTLEVIVATDGSDQDDDGYTLTVDGSNSQPVSINDTLLVSGLEEGSHQVELTGIASNCMLPETSSNPRTVNITGGMTTTTTFDVNCQSLTGTLEVTITTSGTDQDDDGYTLTVDGSNSQPVNIDDNVQVTDLEEGSHQVELTGIAANCQTAASNPRSVSITGGNTTTTTFDVNCQAVQQGQIYFSSNQGSLEIYRMDPDGSNQTAITNNSQYDSFPVPSNDGSRIAFVNNSSGSMDLYVMDADGTNVQQVASSTADIQLGGWSPDDSKIVFYYSDPASSTNTDIYTINADGSGQTQLTNDPGNDNFPAWSPDGNKIAFNSDRDGNTAIYTMNPDGSDIQRITSSSSSALQPRWSPNGSKIVFARSDIYVIDADGSNEIQITDYNADPLDGIDWCRWPNWSPDGSDLVFYCNDYEIHKANADGSGTPVKLTNSPSITDLHPFWGTNQ